MRPPAPTEAAVNPERHDSAEKSWGWRVACFVACLPSGASLLAKLYGIASLRTGAIVVVLPCCLGLFGVWLWARRSRRQWLATLLTIGFFGGLLGTFGYDLVRVPAHLGGQRIFAPISTYGVWIAEADASSRFTDVLGWSYHLSNGITFGLMYALLLRGRAWGWAVLWALILETIAFLSPFVRLFTLSGAAVFNAYLAHVAYGVPLGLVVQRGEDTLRYLARVPVAFKWMAAALCCAALAAPLLVPGNVRRDGRAKAGEFRIEGHELNPDWLRIERGTAIRIYNPSPADDSVVVRKSGRNELVPVASQSRRLVTFDKPGIHRLFVATRGRTRSSFVIAEPVEEVD